MTENVTHVLVFKTNINTESDKLRVMETMKNANIKDWNVDMEDIDRVLRIASCDEEASEIIRLINKTGYQCQELV